MWWSMLPDIATGGAGLAQQKEQVKMDESTSDYNLRMAKLRAKGIRQNAKQRMAAAARQAKEIQRQGDITESDAINAMAAGGTVTDPVMLARLKIKSDLNSLDAVMQGHREYQGMLDQASAELTGTRMSNLQRMTQSRLNYIAAETSFLMHPAGGSTPQGGKSPRPISSSYTSTGSGAPSTYGVGTYRKKPSGGYSGGF